MENKEEKQSAFDSLNDRQKDFVLNYIKCRVATRAYLDAYSTEENPLNYDNASIMASNLLRNIKVSDAIDEKINDIWNNKEKEIGKIFDEFISLGFSDIKNLVNDDLTIKDLQNIDTRAIKKIKIRNEKTTKSDSEDSTTTSDIIEIELHDKKGSLAELADILGLKKQQIELSSSGNITFNHKPVANIEPAEDE